MKHNDEYSYVMIRINLCKLRNRIRCIESNWPMDTYCTYRSEVVPLFQVFPLAKYDKPRVCL